MNKDEYKNLSDIKIIEKFIEKKDDKIFEEIYKRYNKRIYSYMKRFLFYLSEDIIQELLNDVFIKVYLNLSSLKNFNTFKRWLYQIAHNICIDYLKSQQYRSAEHYNFDYMIDRRIDIEKDYMEKELRKFVFQEISKLNDDVREIIILKFYHSLTYEEISDITNIPIPTLKYKLKEALTTLNRKLKAEGFINEKL